MRCLSQEVFFSIIVTIVAYESTEVPTNQENEIIILTKYQDYWDRFFLKAMSFLQPGFAEVDGKPWLMRWESPLQLQAKLESDYGDFIIEVKNFSPLPNKIKESTTQYIKHITRRFIDDNFLWKYEDKESTSTWRDLIKSTNYALKQRFSKWIMSPAKTPQYGKHYQVMHDIENKDLWHELNELKLDWERFVKLAEEFLQTDQPNLELINDYKERYIAPASLIADGKKFPEEEMEIASIHIKAYCRSFVNEAPSWVSGNGTWIAGSLNRRHIWSIQILKMGEALEGRFRGWLSSVSPKAETTSIYLNKSTPTTVTFE